MEVNVNTTWFAGTLVALTTLGAPSGGTVPEDGMHRSPVIIDAGVAVIPSTLDQQAQGIITVVVTSQRNLQPLGGTQVSVAGTGIGGLADANGRIMLRDVPAGTQSIQIQRIGYRTVVQEVTVVSGQTLALTIAMVEEALSLDEVVVTGTAGGTQRRAIGNVVDRISTADVNLVAPVTSVSQLLGGRSAGVTMLAGAGQVGSGQRIRIRGTGSIGLNNDPIVYIDGVRMDSRPDRGFGQRGGASVSRLNDLDP
jgi:hypothetical protein